MPLGAVQKRPALQQRRVQAAAALQNFGFLHRKQTAFVPGHGIGCLVDAGGKVVGHRRQLLYADRRGLHACPACKACTVVLGAPEGAHARIAPDDQHRHMQQPGGQGTFLALNRTADGTDQKGQRTHDQHGGPQLAGTEGQRVHQRRDAPLDGHRDMGQPPIHGRPVAACGRKQAQGRQPRQQSQAGGPVAAQPGGKGFAGVFQHCSVSCLCFTLLYYTHPRIAKSFCLPFA